MSSGTTSRICYYLSSFSYLVLTRLAGSSDFRRNSLSPNTMSHALRQFSSFRDVEAFVAAIYMYHSLHPQSSVCSTYFLDRINIRPTDTYLGLYPSAIPHYSRGCCAHTTRKLTDRSDQSNPLAYFASLTCKSTAMAPSPFEPPHIVLPTTDHSHTIIALHGRGSQGPEVRQPQNGIWHPLSLTGYSSQMSFSKRRPPVV